jgi:hypothetical protein
MRILTHVLLCAASIMSTSVAQAQKYYMRERITGLSPTAQPSYTAGYGSYGACVNGSQSATITSCKDSAGNDVALSLCKAQSISQNCTSAIKCESVQPNRAAVGKILGSELHSKIMSNTEIDTACSRLTTKYPTMTACQAYNMSGINSNTPIYAYGPGTTFEDNYTGRAFGAYCK